jgi:hypothetical protein
VASHLIPHHSLRLHYTLQREEVSIPFQAKLLSGSLEDAAKVKRQSAV